MTGGQKYVLFWSLSPNLSSSVGRKRSQEKIDTTNGDQSERAPESNVAALPSCSTENVMDETFICGVSVGKTLPSITVTGTASGAFVVWENSECVRIMAGAHGTNDVFFYTPCL